MSAPTTNCRDCIHDGCCEHYCGGNNFSPRWAECARCGRTLDLTDEFAKIDGKTYCIGCADEMDEQQED